MVAQIANFAPARIGPMQEAIVARLKLAFPATHFHHATMPFMPSLGEFRRIVQRTPCLGIAFSGFDPDKGNARHVQGRARWLLTLVTRNPQGAEHRLFGNALAPGLYEMIDVAVPLLQGHELAEIGCLMVEKVEPLTAEGWDDEGGVIAGVTLSAPLTMPLTSIGRDPVDLTSLKISWPHEPLQTADGYSGQVLNHTTPTETS